ncbi:hypothetical protein KEM56_001112 [Ascosphaera pollenicola]|nr:hypothetical protein KEM56_001112 [Ascosphaera pollenicola]
MVPLSARYASLVDRNLIYSIFKIAQAHGRDIIGERDAVTVLMEQAENATWLYGHYDYEWISNRYRRVIVNWNEGRRIRKERKMKNRECRATMAIEGLAPLMPQLSRIYTKRICFHRNRRREKWDRYWSTAGAINLKIYDPATQNQLLRPDIMLHHAGFAMSPPFPELAPAAFIAARRGTVITELAMLWPMSKAGGSELSPFEGQAEEGAWVHEVCKEFGWVVMDDRHFKGYHEVIESLRKTLIKLNTQVHTRLTSHVMGSQDLSEFSDPGKASLRRLSSNPAVSDLLDDADRAGEGTEDFDLNTPLTWETTQLHHVLLSNGAYRTIHSDEAPVPARELQDALAKDHQPLLGYWNLKQLIRADIVQVDKDAVIAALSSEGPETPYKE